MPLLELFSFGLFIVLLVVVWQWRSLAVLRRRIAQLEAAHLPARHQLDALLAGTRGVAGRVRGIEQRMRRAVERHDELQQRQVADEIPLRQAVELARKGAVLEELVESCGLSNGEAELLIRLYGPGQAV